MDNSKKLQLVPENKHSSGLHRLIKNLAARKFFSDVLASTLNPIDRFVLWISRGQATATGLLTGLPLVWLITNGAKSGKERRTPLLGFFIGEKVVLIASNFGNARHPAWYHNLRAHPHARLVYDHRERKYLAHEALEAERELYWQKAVDLYPGYERYRERAAPRSIPVMVFEPVE
jgi:deazaflavin-dependent oxidoreductase (nitroreductase family)